MSLICQFFSNIILHQIKAFFFFFKWCSPHVAKRSRFLSNFQHFVQCFFLAIQLLSTFPLPFTSASLSPTLTSGSNIVQILFEVFIILFSNYQNFFFSFSFLVGRTTEGPRGLQGHLVRGRAINVLFKATTCISGIFKSTCVWRIERRLVTFFCERT